VAGLFMVALGLYLAGWWRGLLRIEAAGGHLWRRIEPLGRGLLPVRRVRDAWALGLLWGWLPCGLVYSVLALALLSGSASRGALVMLAFGLGTVPNLLAAGLAVGTLRSALRRRGVRLAAGLAVVGLGVFGALRTPGLIEHVRQGIACIA
jgi:sulfite exporter TauE/SafE